MIGQVRFGLVLGGRGEVCLYFSAGIGAYMTSRFQINRRKTPLRNRAEPFGSALSTKSHAKTLLYERSGVTDWAQVCEATSRDRGGVDSTTAL